MEDIIKNDDEKRQECNEYCNRSVIQLIIMKKDQMMAVKITIKEDMLQLNTEKKRCDTNKEYERNYE